MTSSLSRVQDKPKQKGVNVAPVEALISTCTPLREAVRYQRERELLLAALVMQKEAARDPRRGDSHWTRKRAAAAQAPVEDQPIEERGGKVRGIPFHNRMDTSLKLHVCESVRELLTERAEAIGR